MLAGRALDSDGNLTAGSGVAYSGFGLLGRIVGITAANRNLAAGLATMPQRSRFMRISCGRVGMSYSPKTLASKSKLCLCGNRVDTPWTVDGSLCASLCFFQRARLLPVTRLKIRIMTAKTMRRWIRAPPTWSVKPRSHNTSRITKIVQSILFPFVPEAPGNRSFSREACKQSQFTY
jgi:hypothetical protein